MIRPESLTLEPLNCSLDADLGDYYQDFAAAVDLVEAGYHGGLDEHGVAVTDYGDQGKVRNSIITAQYALGLMTAGRGDEARVQLDALVEEQSTDGEFAGCWVMLQDNRKYPWLRSPWTSALASGTCISALLRGWQQFGNERYRIAAALAYESLHESADLVIEDGEDLWYEEYPAEPPLHVLNGHVYALLGVTDHARATGDLEADERWRRAAATTLRHLDGFDLGYWSAYDLRFREPVALHYQKNIHVPQLRILAALTGEQEFARVADRWERQARSRISRARWQIALRIHARRKNAA